MYATPFWITPLKSLRHVLDTLFAFGNLDSCVSYALDTQTGCYVLKFKQKGVMSDGPCTIKILSDCDSKIKQIMQARKTMVAVD